MSADDLPKAPNPVGKLLKDEHYFTRDKALQLLGRKHFSPERREWHQIIGISRWRGPEGGEVNTLKLKSEETGSVSHLTSVEYYGTARFLGLGNTRKPVPSTPGVKTMNNDSPIIYDVPIEPSLRRPGRQEFRQDEAKSLQGRMLRSTQDANIVGKVVGYHGYREGTPNEKKVDKIFYALEVTWSKQPASYTSKEKTAVFKIEVGKQFEILHGVRAKVAEREWLHHQINNLEPGQRPVGINPGRKR